MSCRPEHVTGYVDGALAESERAEIESHLSDCPPCRAQADAETRLRARLRELAPPSAPADLETSVRSYVDRRTRAQPVRGVHLLATAAALAALVLLVLRSQPQFVAWELAHDHDHCFSRESLPAQVVGDDAENVMRWFESRGTAMPVIPSELGGLELLGGRYCWLPDATRTAHVYYRRPDKGPLSVFVFSRRVSSREPLRYSVRGHVVQIERMGRLSVGLVADRAEDVDAFDRSFRALRAEIGDGDDARRVAEALAR